MEGVEGELAPWMGVKTDSYDFVVLESDLDQVEVEVLPENQGRMMGISSK